MLSFQVMSIDIPPWSIAKILANIMKTMMKPEEHGKSVIHVICTFLCALTIAPFVMLAFPFQTTIATFQANVWAEPTKDFSSFLHFMLALVPLLESILQYKPCIIIETMLVWNSFITSYLSLLWPTLLAVQVVSFNEMQ